MNVSRKSEVLSRQCSQQLVETVLVNVGSVLLTQLYPLLIDVVQDKLDSRIDTCLSGFLDASTAEVGIPTKPAPKQATLYL